MDVPNVTFNISRNVWKNVAYYPGGCIVSQPKLKVQSSWKDSKHLQIIECYANQS